MKVSIGTNIKEGPWGGGNLFAKNLTKNLLKQGHKVVYGLADDDIDIILITEPRKTSESSAFTHIDVIKYLKYINNKALVIHRINECDERKNTSYVNKYLIHANLIADQTVYVSKWIMDLYIKQGIKSKRNKVIYAGADESIFYPNFKKASNKSKKLKVCTHHWGDNWNKGFDAYVLLDSLLSKTKWKDVVDFTYIGKVNKNANFINTKVISPISGKKLAEELRSQDFYITGSINEPSGNHHIEAAQCGLPIMYINSGGVGEYCNGFGIEYNLSNFEEKLNKMIQDLEVQKLNIQKYPFSSEKMCNEYIDLFNDLLKKSDEIYQERNTLKTNYFEKNIYKFVRSLKKNFL